MRKLTQKLVLSVVTMALVVIALGTSTFAWFTLTNSAQTQPFSAQVTAGEGIEVSLGTWTGGLINVDGASILDDASVWYTVIPQSAINARLIQMYGGTTTPNFRFVDLTSSAGDSFANKLGAAVVNAQGYIELPIYFRSAVAKVISVSQVSLTGPASPKTWTVDVPSFTAGNGQDYGTSETLTTMKVAAWAAARLSIVGGGSYGTSGATRVFERDAVTTGDASTVYNSNAVTAYEEATPADGGASYYYAKGNSGDIALPTMPSTLKVAANGSITGGSQSLVTTVAGTVGSVASTYGQVTVRIWIEGFDADTFDAIFNDTLTIQLFFTAV